jgi:two-component system, NarL family, sensor histidine kinase UhpB
MFGGLVFNVINARDNVKAEVASTERLTLYLFDTAIVGNQHIGQKLNSKKPFKLQSLKHMRHVKIEYYDANGALSDTNRDDGQTNFNLAPAWFEQILDYFSPHWVTTTRQISWDGKILGRIEITPDPRYEYAEIWKQLKDALLLISLFFVMVNLLISYVVSIALKPTVIIHDALQKLGEGNLKARMPDFKTHELKKIGLRFNDMADKLEYAIEQNHRLSRQLLTLQEDERKALSRDLHDEFGQALTAIQADAQAALTLVQKKCPEAITSLDAIHTISRHLMKVLSGLLHKIRPQVLDELGLELAIEDLVMQWQKRSPQIQFNLQIENEGLGHLLKEPVRMAIYRMVQESLTNISRHAEASEVKIEMASVKNKMGIRELEVSIQDNGRGFNPSKVKGLGLAGMRERFESLSLDLMIESSETGTMVRVTVPLES